MTTLFYAGLEPGQSAVLKATLRADRADADSRPAASLEAPDGLRVETPAVWIPSLRELAWRIRAERAGDYELLVRVGGTADTKTLRVSASVLRRSPMRVDASWLEQLIYPAEPPLPSSSPLQAISISYPERDLLLFGWGVHWMVVFFVLSMVFAFALRNRLGVTI